MLVQRKMDFAAIALLGVLALLGIAIYTRLGRLKSEAGRAREPRPLAARENAVRMYAVVAELKGSTMTVKNRGAGADLLRAIQAEEVTNLFFKGCGFTADLDSIKGDDFVLQLEHTKSPFLACQGFQDGTPGNFESEQVYLMAH